QIDDGPDRRAVIPLWRGHAAFGQDMIAGIQNDTGNLAAAQINPHSCSHVITPCRQAMAAASTALQSASILTSSQASARVLPRLTAATGSPCRAAART